MSNEEETSNSTCSNCQCSSTEKQKMTGRVSPSLIQIKAKSEEEVKRRIEAFIKNKRNEIDERNIREFISPLSTEAENSCARVEAVYVHREGGKNHIALKRVDNTYGPQTQALPGMEAVTKLPVSVQRAEAVEERLANMEAHLSLNKDGKDIYCRLKALESRIGFLEGLSPEYFRNGWNPHNENKASISKEDTSSRPQSKQMPESLSDINKRIRFLKEVLRQKAR